jgi:hypothetical protein
MRGQFDAFFSRTEGAAMLASDNEEQRRPATDEQPEIDSEELTERISEAIEPALSDISVRVAEAVTERFVEEEGSAEDSDSETAESESDQANQQEESLARERELPSDEEGTAGDSDDESLVGKVTSSFFTSFVQGMSAEGTDRLESLVDSGVEMLFSHRAKGWLRDLADQTLQATLYDALDSIDDQDDRYQLYRETLFKLRPIVRQAVDSMLTDECQEMLKRRVREAIPSVVDGDFETASTKVVNAFSDITDNAEEVIWDNSGDVLAVHKDLAPARGHEAVDGPHDGGLAGAIEADDADRRAPWHLQRHFAKDVDVVVIARGDALDLQMERLFAAGVGCGCGCGGGLAHAYLLRPPPPRRDRPR